MAIVKDHDFVESDGGGRKSTIPADLAKDMAKIVKSITGTDRQNATKVALSIIETWTVENGPNKGVKRQTQLASRHLSKWASDNGYRVFSVKQVGKVTQFKVYRLP